MLLRKNKPPKLEKKTKKRKDWERAANRVHRKLERWGLGKSNLRELEQWMGGTDLTQMRRGLIVPRSTNTDIEQEGLLNMQIQELMKILNPRELQVLNEILDSVRLRMKPTLAEETPKKGTIRKSFDLAFKLIPSYFLITYGSQAFQIGENEAGILSIGVGIVLNGWAIFSSVKNMISENTNLKTE